MACLYLYRHELDDITVLFLNTGKYYPEHLATVEKARAMCPNWIEIKSDRDEQWAAYGFPSDVVPVNWTVFGQKFTGLKTVRVQSYLQCCFENIMYPVIEKAKQLGATEIIRGQRLDEGHKSPSKDGDIVDGVTLVHPVETWTRDEVLAYLKEQMGELPEHYVLEHSSMDCYDCTAYAAHSVDRVQWMKDRHPELYMDFRTKLAALSHAMRGPIESYNRLAGI